MLWPFGNSVVIWFILPRFGILYQEKSGNPASVHTQDLLTTAHSTCIIHIWSTYITHSSYIFTYERNSRAVKIISMAESFFQAGHDSAYFAFNHNYMFLFVLVLTNFVLKDCIRGIIQTYTYLKNFFFVKSYWNRY
jgi:hypothetical protein